MNVRECYGKVFDIQEENKDHGLDMRVTNLQKTEGLPYFGMITSLKHGLTFTPPNDRPLTFYMHKGAVDLILERFSPAHSTCVTGVLREGRSITVPPDMGKFSICGLEETNDLFIFGPAANVQYTNSGLYPVNVIDPVHKIKAWGEEIVIVNNDQVTPAGYCGKLLCMNGPEGLQDEDGDFTWKAWHSSIHKHIIKAETLLVIEGKVRMEFFYYPKNTNYQNESFDLTAGQLVHIHPGLHHRFTGLTKCAIFEASTFHDDNDSYRIIPSGNVDIGPSIFLGNN
ncbi:MAG: hypothetical protein AABW49_03300 [Nanoarchaeota archaeon]